MTIQKPAAARLPRRITILAAGALLIASLPLAAQQRSRPSDSGDHGRTAREAGPSRQAPSSPPPSSSSREPSFSNSPPRTAQPTGPGENEPHRQPPSRGSRGSRDHDGRGHGYHGSIYGSYYDPYYYPYGYWPGLFGWWGWGYGYPYYYPYGGYGHGQPGYYGREGSGGALDLDVAPGRTEVYVDGQYLGKVDAFDGWPRYLWLPKGTYDVVFYLDGYKTIARQISVYPGTVISVDDRMEPGDSVRPESLASKSHERRDERLRYERERSERIDRGERGDDDEDWRDRVRRDRGSVRDDDRDRDRDGRYDADRDDDDDDMEDVEVTEDASRKGRLLLEVDPEDASVYLDGRFVGTGTDLALMRGGLPVAPGDHRLAVVRPGRKAEERKFEVKAGEDVELEIDLDDDSR